jgi:DNA-binding protein HU-beta
MAKAAKKPAKKVAGKKSGKKIAKKAGGGKKAAKPVKAVKPAKPVVVKSSFDGDRTSVNSQIAQAVADKSGLTTRVVKDVTSAFTAIGYAQLKKNGFFVLPGWAKFRVVKKKARAARKGVNPFTKEPCTFKAKPASKSVRARAIKKVKEAVI